MSRIGKIPIVIPAQVKVEVKGRAVAMQGPKGKLAFELPPHTTAAVADSKITVTRDGENAEAKAMHGLGRAILNNMV